MGSSTLLDVVGAIIIGGFMMLTINTLNQTSSENSTKYRSDLIAQQNLVSIVEVLEYDFTRIGYCENPDSIKDPQDMIISADSTSITFWTDLSVSSSEYRGDGIPDRMGYELGPLVTTTPNPDDRVLYRYQVGGTKDGSNLGITEFKIHYFDNMNAELSHPIDPQLISYMQIDIKVEDSYGYDTENPDKTDDEKYPTVFWRQIRLATKNIDR